MAGRRILDAAVRRGLLTPTGASLINGVFSGLPRTAADRASEREELTRLALDIDYLGDVLAIIEEDPASVDELATSYEPIALGLARRLPDGMQHVLAAAALQRGRRSDRNGLDEWWDAVASSFDADLWHRYRAAAGFSIALAIHPTLSAARATEATTRAATVGQLSRWHSQDTESAAEILLPAVLMWLALAQYGTSENWGKAVERRGLAEDVTERAHADPELWVDMLPFLLRGVFDTRDLDIPLSVELAVENSLVDTALEKLGQGVDNAARKARGIHSLARGDAPISDRYTRLLGIVSQDLDAARRFPRPLDLPTRTWLGSAEVQEVIDTGLRRGLDRFLTDVTRQGHTEEEALLRALLMRIEHALTEPQPQLDVLNHVHGTTPLIEIHQRPIPKSEERHVGADLGLLVEIDIPGYLLTNYGTLIQVKKSERLVGRPRATAGADSWRIGTRQLSDVLSVTPSAMYWLVQESGNVLCVPARLVHALARGGGKLEQGSFTIAYIAIYPAGLAPA